MLANSSNEQPKKQSVEFLFLDLLHKICDIPVLVHLLLRNAHKKGETNHPNLSLLTGISRRVQNYVDKMTEFTVGVCQCKM